ncbi:hypothetical protein TNCT_253511 [Trichonephila clavata]|uniref:Uncharacterized protein n=1 Tax=Trichonephila clavata TaxID=2740835 RepID=A0A8X6F0L5_TRICU|nr:hypothetical protein TNCT_253511 [Trichonephila clavata]
MPEKCLLPECIVHTVKFGGGVIMAWKCFSFGLGMFLVDKLGPLIPIHDSDYYSTILDNNVRPTLGNFTEWIIVTSRMTTPFVCCEAHHGLL